MTPWKQDAAPPNEKHTHAGSLNQIKQATCNRNQLDKTKHNRVSHMKKKKNMSDDY